MKNGATMDTSSYRRVAFAWSTLVRNFSNSGSIPDLDIFTLLTLQF